MKRDKLLKNKRVEGLYLHFNHQRLIKDREVVLVEVCAFSSSLSC
jgi:hypothetical protein